MFSCAFCEIFKNIFFIEHLRTTASLVNQMFLCFTFLFVRGDSIGITNKKNGEVEILNVLFTKT